MISSPAAAREVLRDNDATFANRDVPELAMDAVAKGHSDIVFSPHGPGWQMLRKVCVREVLGSATLESVYGLRRREIRNTVRYVGHHMTTILFILGLVVLFFWQMVRVSGVLDLTLIIRIVQFFSRIIKRKFGAGNSLI